MAQGRGIAYAAALLLVTLGLQLPCLQLASAATYTVGDSQGWDINIDYTSWAAGNTYKVGDILFFPYMQELHNVVVVDKAGYDACSASNPIATFSEGNTNVTLSTAGAHYYLCSVIGHCSAGMKLAVTVTASGAATPTAAPPPSKTPTTAPTPSKTPSSSPTKAPSTAPSSTSTPSSAPSPSPSSPAPAPSPEAPASAPTPSSPSAGPSASSTSAPGSSPSSAGTPTSPSNAAPSLLASASIVPLLALWAALFL